MSRSTHAGPRRKDVFVIGQFVGRGVNRKQTSPEKWVTIRRDDLPPAFPFSPTVTGYWQLKKGGRIKYYGRWTTGERDEHGRLIPKADYGADEAQAKLNQKLADAHKGRAPDEPDAAVPTVGSVVSWFLNNVLQRLGMTPDEIEPLAKAKDDWRRVWWQAMKGKRGETMTPRQAMEYRSVVDLLVKAFGRSKPIAELKPDDFARLRAGWKFGTVRTGNLVAWVKAVFNRAERNGVIDRAPKFGDGFAKPVRAAVLKERAERGEKYFTPEECRKLIGAASPVLRSMVLLGINCGFANTDLCELLRTQVDLAGGWVTFRRGKTGFPRRARLWPETLAALAEAYAVRPAPEKADHSDRVFLTKFGNPFGSDGQASAINQEFTKLKEATGLDNQKGRGFGTFRHVFVTHADNAGDKSAARYIAGHTNGHVEAGYIKRTPETDTRIAKVCLFVRDRVLGTEGGAS
jgi:integrase